MVQINDPPSPAFRKCGKKGFYSISWQTLHGCCITKSTRQIAAFVHRQRYKSINLTMENRFESDVVWNDNGAECVVGSIGGDNGEYISTMCMRAQHMYFME